MNIQEVFNDILSNLEYDNIHYGVITEGGKTVVRILCNDGIMKLTVDTEEENNG